MGFSLIEVVLPVRDYDIQASLDVVRGIQERHHRAYLSHRSYKATQIFNFAQGTFVVFGGLCAYSVVVTLKLNLT